MFGYIASFLGFQGQSHSANDNEGNHSVSCEGYGYSLPDPAVRLRLSRTNDSVVRIFGHPPQEDYPEAMDYPGSTMGTEGPPFVHYLYNPGPACLKYVMGDNNWRSQLISGHQSRLRFLEGDVLLRPALVRAKENSAFRTVAKSLKQQEDMKDVCRVLEESGAHFHALIEDCSEAAELNLVHPAQASTIRLRGCLGAHAGQLERSRSVRDLPCCQEKSEAARRHGGCVSCAEGV